MTSNTGRVLVVDDDLDLREAVVDALRSEGYDVSQAKNGADALDAMRRSPPSLVLLDLMMPVMDGWRFREEQLKDPALAQTPVVVFSAAGNIQARADALRAQAYINKPFMLDCLMEVVETYAGHPSTLPARHQPLSHHLD